jgi:DNA repair exonuclease SbcCD nuclease subunit
VLLAGDLFDNVRVAPAYVEDVVSLLSRMGAPVVLLAGNHDLADDSSLLRGHEAHLRAHDVIYLDGAAEVLDGAVRVWGRPVREHRPEFRPLADIDDAERGAADWFIVLGHGHYVPDGEVATSIRSSPILASEIARSGADYVALGHWHHVADVSQGGVPAWYSGSPVALGGSGSMLLVDLDPAVGCTVTPLAVEPTLLAAPCHTPFVEEERSRR